MENLTLGLAFLAGMGYFFSPCTLPLIPSYLVYLSGVSIPQMTGKHRFLVLLHASFFLAGLLFIFVAAGASATLLGNFLGRHLKLLQKFGGGLVILFGILLVLKPPFLYRIPHGRGSATRPAAGFLGSFIIGLSFSAAWTGCSTPLLGAILVTAAVSETVRQGIYLLCAFAFGLAIPFLTAALLINYLLLPLQRVQRHMRKVEIFLGLLFIAFGLRFLLKTFPFRF